MKVFIDQRLCNPQGSEKHISIKSPMQKNKAMTFSTLYEVVPPFKSKQNTIKVDRNILQRLITAYKAGCKVNLEDVLKHELMTVPLSLAKTNGNSHSTNKALLSAVLTQDVHCPASIELDNPC